MIKTDIEIILSHRFDRGGQYWESAEKNIIAGAPFSTLESVMYLLELGMNPRDPILLETAQQIFSTWQTDGRFKATPKGPYVLVKQSMLSMFFVI